MRDGDESPLRRGAAAAGGVVGLLVVWQVLGVTEVFGTSIAPVTEVVEVFGTPRQRSVVVDAALATAGKAVRGFAWGAAVAALLGGLVVLVPPLRRGVDQLATIQSAIPFVALGPILLANLDRQSVPVGMAACTVFFTIYTAVVSGLHSASPAVQEVFAVFGSSRRQRFVRAHLPAALPVVATGLKVAMPLAIVGTVIGEWFGASKGVGPLLLTTLRNYQMPMMWATASATVIVALALFLSMAVVERAAAERFGASS